MSRKVSGITSTIGWLAVLGFAGYWLYEKFVSADSLTYKLYNLTIGAVNVGQPLSLVVTFTINNATKISSTISGITGTVLINGTTLSNVISTQSVTVDPDSSANYSISFYISVSTGILQLINLLKSGSAIVSFTGSIIVDGVTLPFTDLMTV